MYSIFHIEGGLGKHIAATAVAKQIKEKHSDRELIIVCAYPELFLELDFVDRVYKLGFTAYFYQDYIKDKDFLLFRHEPYHTESHVKRQKHLIDSWCDLYDLDYPKEIKPVLELNHSQLLQGALIWGRQKPIMLIQTNGGTQNDNLYSWTRDIPIEVFHQLVHKYSKDYHIIQICENKKQVIDPNIESISERITDAQLTSLIMASSKRVFIDSALQHIAAGFDLKSTVLWIGTDPKVFGYEIHDNIQANIESKKMLHDSYLFEYNITGSPHESPIKAGIPIFDEKEIFKSLDNEEEKHS